MSEQTLQTQMATLIEIARAPGYPSFVECATILKRTWRLWLIAAGAIFGLIAVIALVKSVTERTRNAREIVGGGVAGTTIREKSGS